MLVQFPIFFEALSIGRIELHLWLTVNTLKAVRDLRRRRKDDILAITGDIFRQNEKNLFGVSGESKLFPVPRPCVAVDWTNSEAKVRGG